MATANGSEARPCTVCGHLVIGAIHDEGSFVHGHCANPRPPAPPAPAGGPLPAVDAWDAWQRGLDHARRILAAAEAERSRS